MNPQVLSLEVIAQRFKEGKLTETQLRDMYGDKLADGVKAFLLEEHWNFYLASCYG